MQRLKQNIMDVVQEGQLKLGYRAETLRLYYPLASLCAFAGRQMDAGQMHQELEAYLSRYAPEWGPVQVSRKRDRFCLSIPPQGVAAIHEQLDQACFLAGFIREIERHGCTIDDLIAQFTRFSSHVHVEELHNGEFDYLVYFEDGVPDGFYYCIADEGCHMTYHRFTREDYEAFGF